MRRLDLVVGPNGAGKSTFVRLTLARVLPAGLMFVNADEIARHRWPDAPEAHSYEAAELAARTRDALLRTGESFIAETVFSHPSKLELIRNAQGSGYTVALHVLMVPEDLSVERVAHRVRSGGHAVPEEKIRQRHRRLWQLVAAAAERADATTFYDGAQRSGPRISAQLAAGAAVGAIRWPSWVAPVLSERWPRT